MGKNNAKAPVVIVGAGYVGLVTAVGLAQAREVRLVDKKSSLIKDLEAGRMPFSEPGLEERFVANRTRLSFYTELDDALEDGRTELVFIAVDTPKRAVETAARNGDGNSADLTKVHAVIDQLLSLGDVAVVMKSTVPPGTGAEILERVESGGSDLAYLSCPEFLQEGEAFASFDRPDRIVVGLEEPSSASRALRELHIEIYPNLGDESEGPKYREMKLINAEMIKHASNLHLAIRISYANEIGNLCEEVGADVTEVMEGVGADDRIGPRFLDAGIGFGGSCFEKDIRALKSVARKKAGLEISFVDTVLAINKGQVERVIGKLERRLCALEDARIAILGLAFKPDTDDLRGGPAFTLADELRKRGASVRAWDPHPDARRTAAENSETDAQEWVAKDEIATTLLEAIEGTDAVVLVTEWPEFSEVDWEEAAALMRGKLVIDGRNQLSPEDVRAAGLEYEGTGRESRGLARPLPEGAADG